MHAFPKQDLLFVAQLLCYHIGCDIEISNFFVMETFQSACGPLKYHYFYVDGSIASHNY